MLQIDLPGKIEVMGSATGIRFRGTAEEIVALADDIRAVSRLPPGGFAFLQDIERTVGNAPSRSPHRITLRARDWNIMSSLFKDVAYGWEESPFDFNDSGFLLRPLTRNLGV